MTLHQNGDRKGKAGLVDDGYNPFERLEDLHVYDNQPSLFGGADNVMPASQETQGFPAPAQSHGSSIVVEKEKQNPDQPAKDKTSVLLYTSHIKPRLKWTPKLHACFTDAITELGGAASQ